MSGFSPTFVKNCKTVGKKAIVSGKVEIGG